MSWASIYWDLDHIVQAAREAMEAAYALDPAGQTSVPPLSNPAVTEPSVVESLNVDPFGARPDALGTAAIIEFSIASQADVSSDPEIKHTRPNDVINSYEAALCKSSLEANTLTPNDASVQMRNLWTPEIEAALREFLRPLSVNLRHEYRFQDALDERRSIAMINDLFTRRAKPDDIKIRDVSSRNEFRRKRNEDPRRSQAFAPNAKKPLPSR